MENLYTNDCIRTFTGKYMNVFAPTHDMICIEDIAHGLANQCRFGGHLPMFYSVAQHSYEALNFAAEGHELQVLMHDASEAYLMDIPKPIKNKLSNYKEIEDSLMRVIADKFGFPYPLSLATKDIDNHMLQWEWESLMLNSGILPEINVDGRGMAKHIFLNRFYSITTKTK